MDPYTNSLVMSADPLPQPYRLIDGILNFIVNTAFEESLERENIRLGKSKTRGTVDVDNLPSVLMENPDVLETNGQDIGSLDQQHMGEVTAFQTSADGRFLFAGAADGRLFAMSVFVEEGRQRTTMSATVVVSEQPVVSVSIVGVDSVLGDDGEMVTNVFRIAWASKGAAGVITVNTDNWATYRGCSLPVRDGQEFCGVTLSQDASYLALASVDGKLDVYYIRQLNPGAVMEETEENEASAYEAAASAVEAPEAKNVDVETGVLSKTVKARTALAVLTKSLQEHDAMLLTHKLHTTMPPPATAVSESDRPKVEFYFLHVLAERKFSAPSTLQTCALCVLWSGDLLWQRYELYPQNQQESKEVEVDKKGTKGKASTNAADDCVPASPDYTIYMPAPVSASALSADTTKLAVGCDDGSIIVYDNILATEHTLLQPQEGVITSLSFCGTNVLVASSYDGRVSVHTISSLSDSDRAYGFQSLEGTLGSMRISDKFPRPITQVCCLQGSPLAMVSSESGDQEGGEYRFVLDVDSCAIIARVLIKEQLPKTSECAIHFARGRKVAHGFSARDQVFTLIDIKRTVAVEAPMAEEEKEDLGKTTKNEKKGGDKKGKKGKKGKEAVTESPVVEKPPEPSFETKVISRVGVYTFESILQSAYPYMVQANQRIGGKYLKTMLTTSVHVNRLQTNFFDDFEPPMSHKLDSLLVDVNEPLRSARSKHSSPPGSNPGSRPGSRPSSSGSTRSTRSTKSTRSNVSRTSSRSKLKSSRSNVSSRRSKKPLLEEPTVVDALADDGSPFNDPSQHLFRLLQEREITRAYRNQRMSQRKEELAEMLNQ